MRDRAFDRLDDVGQADVGRRARQREAAAGAASAAQQAGAGELAHQFLRGRQRHAGLVGKRGRGQPRARGAAGGGGHQHDRIIGKMATGAWLIRSFPVRFRLCARENQLSVKLRSHDEQELVSLYPLIRPLAFALDAEAAHRATIAALKALPGAPPPRFDPVLTTSVAGLGFPSPVGLAAGFDKDAEVADAMLGLGFGFVEVGTLTPRPQAGNPQAAAVPAGRGQSGDQPHGLQQSRPGRCACSGCAGATARAAWSASISAPTRTAPTASPIMSRACSAMTPRRRLSDRQHQLAQHARASPAAGRGRAARSCSRRSARRASSAGRRCSSRSRPTSARASPTRSCGPRCDHGVDALIVANTTVSRPPLKSRYAGEQGGLSGEPLRPLALDALRRFRAGERRRNAADRGGRDRQRRRRVGADPRRGEPRPALFGDGLSKGRGSARRIARGLGRARSSAPAMPVDQRGGGTRMTRAFAARVVAAVDPPAIADDAPRGRPESSPWPGLTSIPRARERFEHPGGELGRLRPESWRRARRGWARPAPAASACPSRSRRPATWRRRRGWHCRPADPIAPAKRPSRSSRISGVIDDRGRLPGATALAAGPPSRTGRGEREIGQLVVEEEAVDHPARLPKIDFDRGGHAKRHCRPSRGR